MKFLIIPGYAKSGTTFLSEHLAICGAPINLPKRKELNFFQVSNNFEQYMDQFETRDPDKVFLDASPLYAPNADRAIDNMKSALKGHDVKFIFCLREPLSRAYSHYMHDISTHIFLYAHGPYSFYSPATLKNYFFPLSRAIRSFNKAFGGKNTFGFGFKSTGNKLSSDVIEFLGLPKNWELDFSSNPALGGSIPRIYYDADRPLTVRSGRNLYGLPPRHFLMASIRYPQIRTDFPENIAMQFMQSQSSWDRQFTPDILGPSIAPIREDYLRCFDQLRLEPEVLAPPKTIYANEPPELSPQICSKLEKLGTVSATVVNAFRQTNKKAQDNVARDKFFTIPEALDDVARASGKSDGERARAYEKALDAFGPIPAYVQGYLRHLIRLGDGKRALKYLQRNPNLSRYISYRFVLEDLERYEHKFKKKMFAELRRYLNH